MRTALRNTKIALGIALLFSIQKMSAQLGFCSGNSGEPIFIETFGSGTTDGPALAAGTTTYTFTTGTPNDGSYTISSTTNYFDWHNAQDHTPNDSDGKMLIVNASYTADRFYRREITGLCENTSYEFSAWLLNMAMPTGFCEGSTIPINVKFQIWDGTDTELLASGDTGQLFGQATPTWNPYGLVFKTKKGQTAVILKMINNGNGGCGNDLGIDDIAFSTCGDFVSLANGQNETFIAHCEKEGAIGTTLTATPDFSIFTDHAYQWQQSFDGINWSDILNETSSTYTTPLLSTSTSYRVKVAEDPINVSNSLCNILSEVFDVLIVPTPEAPISNGDVALCANETPFLTVTVPTGIKVNWYDAEVGGNLLLEASSSFTPEDQSVYFAEAVSSLAQCNSLQRTQVTYTSFKIPETADENIEFCEGETVMLSANSEDNDLTYFWNTGETTASIQVDTQGTYTVTLTNTDGCSALKTIELKQIDFPKISKIVSDSENIVVTTDPFGEFEYALDHGSFQGSPIFENIQGGLHTIQVRATNACSPVEQEFRHFVIPKFFTPNGDGLNDTFVLQGLELFEAINVTIFDRFGTLLAGTDNASFEWDGTAENRLMPASDYWYLIKVDSLKFSGHFTLKR